MKLKLRLFLLVAGMSIAHADDLSVSAGGTYLRGQTDAFAVTYTHPIEHRLKLETTVVYIDDSNQWNRDQPAKWVLLQRVSKKLGPVEFAIGGSYATVEDDYNGSRLNFSESLRYRFNNHWHIEVMHISNAGLKSPNLGRDIVLGGYDW